ncbi:MAG: TonB-dependent receptor [Pseudomonadales bacterium]|nr:TonB-dependent receptor [Pseudomonadales bacterium]
MDVSRKRFIRNALYLSITAASLGLWQSAAAQQVPDDGLEEINVTGSRITLTSGMNSPVPVTVLTPAELRDFEPGSTISQQLDTLPQFFNNGTPQRGDGGNAAVGSGGPGALNIRNLNAGGTGAGISRTLTLLDGARVVPTDKRGTVNVDMFPTALMRSVDVVTGGASAAYGADALGGVVNFVLDRRFEGLRLGIGTGVQEYKGTGKQLELSVAGGTNFLDGRLHLIGSLEARRTDEIQGDRYRQKSSREQWGYVTNPDWIAAGCSAGVACSAGPQRLSLMNVVTANDSPTGLFRGTGTSLDWMQFTVDGTGIEPFDFGDVSALPGIPGSSASISGGKEAETAFLTSSNGPTGMEAKNRSAFFGLQYDFSETLSGFVQAMAGRTESNDTSNNANFTFNGTSAPLIAIDNAYLPQVVRDVMIANNLTQISVNKRSAQFDGRPELGSDREARNIFTQWQYGFGVDWGFMEKWNLRASWQRGESKRNSQALNLQQVDRAFLGMDAVVDPVTGNIVCRVNLFNPTLEQLAESVAGRISKVPLNPYIPAGLPGNTQPLPYPVDPQSITDCVPYNVLGSGNMSQEAIDYVGTTKVHLGYVDQDFAEILLTGQLHEGWGAGPIGFAGGLTWRDQQFIATALPKDLDLLGPPLNVPSLGIRGIPPGFTGGGANLHLFSTAPTIGGQTDVWEWFAEMNIPVWDSGNGQALVVDFAARRSTYDRSGAIDSWKVGTNLDVIEDLRFRVTRSRDVREPSFSELFDAQATGANITDRTFNNENYLITTIRGGNPNLKPEVATTNTAGVVYQPTFVAWIDGLQISVDWYDVQIADAVAQLGSQRIVDECAAGVTSVCGAIERGNDGRVVFINDGFLNVAGAAVRGIDTEVQWRAEPNLLADHDERLTLRWLTGFLKERSDTPLGGTPQNNAGVGGLPTITSNFTATYAIDAWSLQLQARYIDSVKRNRTWIEGIDVDDNTVASMTWFNGRVGYNGELDNGGSWSLGLNVQNLFNREPPIFGGGGNYDDYGRRYNLSLNFSW